MMLDFDLDFLRDAVALIDVSLERLDREVKASSDPEAFGIFDQMEYLSSGSASSRAKRTQRQ